MPKINEFLINLLNNVLANILTPIVLVIATLLIGVVIAFSSRNPQVGLAMVLVALVLINTTINLLLFRQGRYVLKALQEASPLTQRPPDIGTLEDPLARQLKDEFEITDKRFDDTSEPQELVVKFTNRGNGIVRVTKVRYSDTGLGLPDSALVPTYRKESGRYYIIPFEQDKAEVLPGCDFVVEVYLAQKWTRQDINRMAGDWGYLRLEVLYNEQPTELLIKF